MRYKPNICYSTQSLSCQVTSLPSAIHTQTQTHTYTHTQGIERDMKLVFVICRYYSLQATITSPVWRVWKKV